MLKFHLKPPPKPLKNLEKKLGVKMFSKFIDLFIIKYLQISLVTKSLQK